MRNGCRGRGENFTPSPQYRIGDVFGDGSVLIGGGDVVSSEDGRIFLAQKMGVTHVLNAAIEVDGVDHGLTNLTEPSFTSIRLNAVGSEDFDLSCSFTRACDFIDMALEPPPPAWEATAFGSPPSHPDTATAISKSAATPGRVYIHGNAGVNRSTTVLLAYLILRRGYTLEEAFELAAACCPEALPNMAFWGQLVALDKTVNGSTAVRHPSLQNDLQN